MNLPWKLEDPPVLEEGCEWADLWWPYAAGRKVLVIEDHPPYLEYLQRLLRLAGYVVISATRASEGVQKAREEQPDAIVMDRRLPALRRFRPLDQLGKDPATAIIPTILLCLGREHYSWRPRDENVGYASGDPTSLVEVLRRLDITAKHRTEAAVDTPSDPPRQSSDAALHTAAPTRILAADDERHVARLMETHLRQAGYEVVTCFDYREVLEQASTDRPDVIVMDYMMQVEISWLIVFSALQADPVTARIPLVLLTSKHPGVSSSLWLPPNGSIARFLVKPFSPAELLTAVAAAL